jgi:hypothetical protein
MSGRPVNIADFRCRTRKARTAYFSLRDANRSHGLRVVEPANTGEDAVEYLSQENPGVFDIGIAREVQRLRRRAARPLSIHLRGKVIRFGEMPARAAAAMRAPASWPVSPDGPYDPPPAA